jgi:hypothetical protein
MPSADVPIHNSIAPQRVDRTGLSVREDVLYTDAKGRDKKKLHKRAEYAFEYLGDVLRRIIEPGETIFYIAEAQVMPGALGQFLGGGWHMASIPRNFLFITERRVIALRLRKRMSSWSWNRGIRTVRWGDVLKTVGGRGRLSRSVILAFRNGEKQAYWRFAWGEAKKVRLLIDTLQPNGSGETTAAGGMISLCPNCLAPLATRSYHCPQCGTRFKDEKTLMWRGIFVPGGASLYVGATGLGVFRAIFETAILASVFFSLYRAIRAPTASSAAADFTTAIVGECAFLFLDKLFAILMSLPLVRDFIPAE